ncbi:MAG: calcium-translocating P-type ATPase, PMCA-type [Christensenellales bacterium]
MQTNKPLFFTMTANEVMQHLNTHETGLMEQEARFRYEQYGPNRLPGSKKISLLRKLVNQLTNVMVVILSLAALVALFVGDYKSTIIIVAVVIMNAILGVLQENKAEKAIESLQDLSSPEAEIRREGYVRTIKAEGLVIGDVVILEAGDHIPADMRLIEAANLKIEEAALTGESMPVEKSAHEIKEPDAMLGDRINMAYMGTHVVYGRGTGVVTAIGIDTEVGKIARYLSQNKEKEETPLQKKLAEMSKYISFIIVAVSFVIFITGLLWGRSVFEMFLTAVSLAVAAIPEGLPAIVTIVLALGIQKMAKKNAIIRKLPAVETLGSTQVICTDKTGTLTKNEMTVVELYHSHHIIPVLQESTKPPYQILQAMVLCNDARESKLQQEYVFTGDPTETALLKFAALYSTDKNTLNDLLPRVAEIPFDSTRKLMTTVHSNQEGTLAYTKGALDVLLEKCDRILINGLVRSINSEDRQSIENANKVMAQKAMRVLAFAFNEVHEYPNAITSEAMESNLVFVGFVGMIDPPRPEVRVAVQTCRNAGIKPVMITGDHKVTACAIAQDLGIMQHGDIAIEGRELEQMNETELLSRVEHCSVYARVSPEHKVRIVHAWKHLGKTTAMTGDGVNDAPALKAADISIGMGITGTDVAKGVSDIILADDNFATIVSAVSEGRRIFVNIKKAIQFLLSTHLGEVFALFIATMFNWIILYPIHLLWVNLIIDTLPALALGMEKPDDRLMQQKPRSSEQKFFAGGLGVSIIVQGLMKGMLVLAAYLFAQKLHSQEVAVTTAFATLGLVQLAHTFTLRSDAKSIFKLGFFTNKFLLWAVIGAVLMQIVIIIVPAFNNIFKVTQMNWEEWLITITASLLIIPLVELYKWIIRRKKG